jgi:hypothetical protein
MVGAEREGQATRWHASTMERHFACEMANMLGWSSELPYDTTVFSSMTSVKKLAFMLLNACSSNTNIARQMLCTHLVQRLASVAWTLVLLHARTMNTL